MTAKHALKLVSPRSRSRFRRPMPADALETFQPAPDLLEWAHRTILDTDGPLHNEDHAHLKGADIEFMWAPEGYAKAGRYVLGTTEQVMFMSGGWKRQRQEQQFDQWFGRTPSFLITLAASYCAACTDAEFCSLVEHELYHIAQAMDARTGAPAFDKATGMPKLCMRGHDVEEFIGVVRRYGAGGPESAVSRLVEAAKQAPEVPGFRIADACGVCLERAA